MTFQVESGESWSRSFHRKHPPTCMQSSWKVGGHLQVQSLAAPELFGHGKGGGHFWWLFYLCPSSQHRTHKEARKAIVVETATEKQRAKTLNPRQPGELPGRLS